MQWNHQNQHHQSHYQHNVISPASSSVTSPHKGYNMNMRFNNRNNDSDTFAHMNNQRPVNRTNQRKLTQEEMLEEQLKRER